MRFEGVVVAVLCGVPCAVVDFLFFVFFFGGGEMFYDTTYDRYACMKAR
jgi:hypothetical protein